MNELIKQLKATYQQLNAGNLALLTEIYTDDVEFIDPFHKVHGLPALKRYFANLYQNVDSITFAFGRCVIEQDKAMLTWTMTLIHRRLNGGKPVQVAGISELAFNSKIFYHRDYFDAGTMIYEQLPVLRSIIAFIKRRMA